MISFFQSWPHAAGDKMKGKRPMKLMKGSPGFTLAELIIVIAILAVLVGIAIPAYSGYIEKAESLADAQMLDRILTAAQTLMTAEGQTVSSVSVGCDLGVWYVKVQPFNDGVDTTAVVELTGALSFSEDFIAAVWSSDTGQWTIILFSEQI